uniref:Rap guanine nucleotide exchange factor 5 n=1 Tax=Callorhinchus milii TaxID=7868 RepID=A0A4W3JR21_CALMI
MGSSRLRVFDAYIQDKVSETFEDTRIVTLPAFDVPYFKYIDEDSEDEWSIPSQSSTEDDSSVDSSLSDRYVVVSGTPEKILEHLLNDLHLEEGECKETDILLDDFLLTYTVFMSTNDLSQALLRQYPFHPYAERPGHTDNGLYQKRKVLRIVSQWVSLYKNLLREDENTKLLLKNLYKCVLDDLFEYPGLEKELKELQNLFRIPLFHQLSCREKWLHPKGCPGESDEVFCRVYVADHSYVSFWTKESTSAQEVLHAVAEKLQKPEQDLILVAITSSEGEQILQPDDVSIFKSLDATTRIFVCRKDPSDFLTFIAEDDEAPHRSIRMLGMNTWHMANELTSFDWDLFNCICEQELICYIFRRQDSGRSTVNLNLLLQRCNEVQFWVATEILLCSQLSKRVQLVKKFIKIAAHCRALRNLNSFFAIIMGLNSAAVCRLGQTWEVRREFSQVLVSSQDPSLNHKAYRDAFKKMQAPKIPFMPLLLKDVTFIHEGNKTFLDNLVNFQKLHMIADTVRLLRHCRSNQKGTYKEHQDVKTYIQYLHIIDNQQMLFQLSHRLEPRT